MTKNQPTLAKPDLIRHGLARTDTRAEYVTSIRIRMIKDLASTGGVDMVDYSDMPSEDFFAARTQILAEYKGKIGNR